MSNAVDSAARRRVFARDGIVMIEYALTATDLRHLAALFEPAKPDSAGQRQMTMTPSSQDWLATHPALTALVSELSLEPLCLARILIVDKSPAANWFVPWHQGRTTAPASRLDTSEWGTCNVKNGHHQVNAPAALLARMIILRIHLDRCDENNGPLEVIRGTHEHGRLNKTQIAARVADTTASLCLAEPGDVLAMRPLLLHRSQRAMTLKRHRLLRLDFGPTIARPPRHGHH